MKNRQRIKKIASLYAVFSLVILLFPGQARTESGDKKLEEMEAMFEQAAEEEEYLRAERLLISATGSLKPLRLAPSVASVITAEDIEKMGAVTLDEVLETVPGLHVTSSSNGSNNNWAIRGIYTDLNPQVLFLLNGLPFKKLYSASRPSGFNLPVASISRIEVVRGPGSAVHGADAYAGTINVITKDGEEIDGTETGLRAGSFDTYDAWLQHGKKHNGWDLSMSLEMQRTHGDDDRIINADAQTAFDNVFGPPNVSLTPGPLDTEYEMYDLHLGLMKNNWTIRWWSWILSDAGVIGGVGSALDPRGYGDSEAHLLDIAYRNKELVEDWDLSMRLRSSYYHENAWVVMFPPGHTRFVPGVGVVTYNDGLIGNPIVTDKVSSIDFTAFYEGIKDHYLRLATGIQFQDLDTDSNRNYGLAALGVAEGVMTNVKSGPYVFLNDQHRTIWNVSIQDEWSFARAWELTGGVRYDHYDDFGETINPRAALVWETRYDLTTKLLYGKAFRPPSFNELYSAINPVAQGNEDLEPETIQTYELAFDYQPTANLRTIFNVFHYDIEDLIEQVSDNVAGTLRTAQNNRNVRGNGFEIEVDWRMTDTIRLKGNYAFQRSKDKATGEITPDTPATLFYANANWEFLPEWSLDARYNFVGDRHRVLDDARAEIDDYDTVDLTVRRKNIVDHWDFALAVRNLADEGGREPAMLNIVAGAELMIPGDLPLEGRSVWGEMRYHF